jgi:hypothetical protein
VDFIVPGASSGLHHLNLSATALADERINLGDQLVGDDNLSSFDMSIGMPFLGPL